MDPWAAADLEELARRDDELAVGAARLRELDEQVGSLRSRAEALDTFFATYREEESRRHEAVTAAETELTRRRAELAAVERELTAARDTEARERAERARQRARDHVTVAESMLERARSDGDELERDASTNSQEIPELEARARAVAAQVDVVPPTPTGVRELVDWASRAHAALFVAVGQLDAERDRVIREANELATMLLGEPTYGSTVSQLAQRVLPLARE
ncbi:MAG TPA: hypothetical protein VFI04_08250 [Gaiellaceae bacterium]|nr:hypothetical protein [Gaiellaceae bacterium]